MTARFNVIFQLCAFIAQGANVISGYLPLKYQAAFALVVGFAQAVVSWKAHYANPDGTPASVAYTPAVEGFKNPKG